MRKRFLAGMFLAIVLTLSACTESKLINGKLYEPYGLLNEDKKKDPQIHYEISTGNFILGVVFSESVLIPIYIFGFDLWEPVGPINPN